MQSLSRIGPLINTPDLGDTKDPCPVFDGRIWHIFGSLGSSSSEVWQILHATSPNIDGPWKLEEPTLLLGIKGDHVAAPGVVFDKGIFQMFIQTDFTALNTKIEYLTSTDRGKTFRLINTALHSIPDTDEAGIYDPHPSVVDGQRYLVYTGVPQVSHGDIFLARSLTNTWEGPWVRVKKILAHEDVYFHNPHNHPDYEWGLEGAQLIELPDGKVLLNAVCFLAEGERGTRQRVFFALADQPEGPYKVLEPALLPTGDLWGNGENGHASGVVVGNNLKLFYQARSFGSSDNHWRYGLATFDITDLEAAFVPDISTQFQQLPATLELPKKD